ncbi:small, acid-soluble spore protein L [Sutcliffiella rhizosphaerae]|uniref:Small, acid-soluble spore protein L n=1 Tax=Sutcliffiella rhizosphaerae TaxID=2880967 RepID=A0ABM8YUW5_9BACI|nr:small, acid-soluble spore protein L [Sutcliffiella rhizosphaerae]CAG9623767.1 hypothetical protein BACCIP111883_04601 [Sutcliffiella rhizosphaerae]
MSKHTNEANRGKKAPGINPQGFDQNGEVPNEVRSKLENKAKKDNTKR